MDEHFVRKFTNPPTVDELGRIASLDNKIRVSVKGEVSNVSCCNILRDKILHIVEVIDDVFCKK